MKEKEEKIEVEGEVIEALRSRMFRVRLDNGHEALGYMGGRMKRYRIRAFPGDSGDGMQLTGDRFTSETAVFGNDLATLPDFPAEIRAPAGSLPGVSGFQVHFADHDLLTPGRPPSRLVAT